MQVWCVCIVHEYGTNVTAHSTEEKAKDSLFEFVKEWWQREINDHHDNTTIPEDRDEAIAYYFEHGRPEEWYAIDCCEVDGD